MSKLIEPRLCKLHKYDARCASYLWRVIEVVITRRSWKFASIGVAKTQKSLVNTDFSGTPKATENSISKNISKKLNIRWFLRKQFHIRRDIEVVITRRSWKFASIAVAKTRKSLVNTDFSGTSETSQKRISKNISKKIEYLMISAKAVSYTEGYRSGHNEAVLKTSFVFLGNFLKTLDFIGFFGGRLAFCEKPFSQFSRNFLT